MSNKFQIPLEVLDRITKRDQRCVYCRKSMKSYAEIKATTKQYKDQSSLEHLYYKKPFYWRGKLGKLGGLTEIGIAICCRGCNSSRRDKPLREWFKSSYCIDGNINEKTVAEPVRKFIDYRKKIDGDY